MPADFTGHPWERFEPETVRAVADWVRAHPRGTMLDVGCSFGIFSLLARTVSRELRVVAFDADVASVKAARRMCGPLGADGGLELVHGFVSDAATRPGEGLADAVAATTRVIDAPEVRDDVSATRFRFLQEGAAATADIPARTLDQLGLDASLREQPVLLKCDVEGAELHVLRGARGLLRAVAPTICLSVHPALLAAFGYGVADVRALLDDAGYSARVIAVDHEEHWWCEPANR
jgi:FkbM family methyltransferase